MELVNLEGANSFFGGQIQATVKLHSVGLGERPGKGEDTSGRSARAAGGPGGGMGERDGGRHGGGPGGGERRGGGEEAMRETGGQGLRGGSMGPGQVFSIQLMNTSSEQLTLAVWEFNSALGNFAVRPTKLVIEPGGTAAVEPMTTRLGGAGDGFEVALTLRTAKGEERRVIVLKEKSLEPAKRQ